MNVATYNLLSHLRCSERCDFTVCFRIYCAMNVVTYSFNSLLSHLLCSERCDLQFYCAQFAFAFRCAMNVATYSFTVCFRISVQ
jgi:hypothetical protein